MLNTNFIPLRDALLDKSVLDNLEADTNSRAFIEETLNATLRSALHSACLDNGHPILAGLIEGMESVDIASSRDVPLRMFVAAQVEHKLEADLGLQEAVDEAIGQVSDITTVSDLLELDTLLRNHPLFQEEVQKAELSSLLSTSPVMEDLRLQEQFIRLYAVHEGPIQDFWSNLRVQPEFEEPGTVEALQFTLQLGLLTQDNVSLVKSLQELHQRGIVQSIRDLAKLDIDDWTDLISASADGHNTGVPPSIPGATVEERAANYASAMITTLQEAFPTAYVAQSIAKPPEVDLALLRRVLPQNPQFNPGDPLPDKFVWTDFSMADQERTKASLEALHQEIKLFPAFDHESALAVGDGAVLRNPLRQAVSQFFANEPDFDFRDAHIDTYLAEHAETAFRGIDDEYRDTVSTQLKCMQRVFQVTPRADLMNVLMGASLYSAHSIASIPQATFIARFQDRLGGEMQARLVYNKAQYIQAAMLNVFTQVHQAMNDVSPRVIGSPNDVQSTIKQIPNWPNLFGSLELCDCEDCRSVYSPAAYLVDLLQFLGKSLPTGGKTPRDVLFERRPDLQYIQLTCENTNTRIPYLDLVNEILESSLAPGQPPEAVYDLLKRAIFPLSLPYNRALEVARTYLQYLGSSPFEVMKTFQRNDGLNIVPSDTALACEYLAISPEEYTNIFTDALAPVKSPWEFFGYIEQDFYPALQQGSSGLAVKALQLKLNTAGANPALTVNGVFDAPTQNAVTAFQQGHALPPTGKVDAATWAVLKGIKPDSWLVYLASVPELLNRTGIQYLDLIELLKTRFLNPHQASTLQGPVDDNCDLTQTEITNLDGIVLKKMNRFIRLWRKSGWQIRELDKAIKAMGALDFDDALLQKLAQLKQVQAELNVPLVQLLSLWSNIDTYGDDALYTTLFQNKAVFDPVDAAFALNPDGTELAVLGQKISAHTPTILAALRLRTADLAALTASVASDDALNLANLSALYRCTLLARALNLSITNFLALLTLTGDKPFVAGWPDLTVKFLDEARRILQSNFSFPQLNYLYWQLYQLGVTSQQESVDLLFENLQSGLKKIANDNAVVPDPTGNVLQSKLSILWDGALVNEAIKLLAGSATYTTHLDNLPVALPDPLKDKISYDAASKTLRYTGNMTQAERTTLLNLSPDASYQSAINVLFQQPRDFISKNMALFLNPVNAIATLLEDPAQTTEQKYLYVLTPFIVYLQVLLGKRLIKQALGDALSLDTATVDLLLESVLKSRTDLRRPSIVDFLPLLTGGLDGWYSDMTGNTVTRIDPSIDFDWGKAGSPDPALTAGSFNAGWWGRVIAQHSEPYTFYTRTWSTGNSVSLWVDDQRLIEYTGPKGEGLPEEQSATIVLKAGQLYEVIMQYSNDHSYGLAQLSWSSPSTGKTVIPKSQLYPHSAYVAFSALRKAALLINTFKMSTEEARYLSIHSDDFGGFDFNALPVDFFEFSDKVALFKQWEQLNDLFRFRDGLPRAGVGLFDVFATASSSRDLSQLSDATVNHLAGATGWDRSELASLAGPDGFKLTDGDFKNAMKLPRLQACFSLSKRLGTSVKQLLTWAATEPDTKQAQAIIALVKAQYGDDQWPTVAQPLNDGLREALRSALIACLLQTQQMKGAGVSDSNQLYEYFLIDVDMGACMTTSRIVQACSTVQVFVQRCLMNLEAEVTPSAIDNAQWQWMKSSSLWAGNRKIFLYPENWLEPALRDDKSSFFKELETELLQNDITMDTVEQAFLNYLEKLNQVSRLEICGMYWQREPIGFFDWPKAGKSNLDIHILHVFARTFAIPHIYYYRRLINGATWTPWEKVNVDIEGDHLIPVVYNRRLHLLWPVYAEKADTPTFPDQKSPPQKYLEIKVAWSDYTRNNWSPKRISNEYVFHTPNTGVPNYTDLQTERPSFFFQVDIVPGQPVQMYVNDQKASDKDKPLTPLVDITFNSCTGNLDFTAPQNAAGSSDSPPQSHIKFMIFEEDSGANNLILSDRVQNHTILNKTPSQYTLLPPLQSRRFFPTMPFFYQDKDRSYFVIPSEPIGGTTLALREPDRVKPGHRLSLIAKQAGPGIATMEPHLVFERGNPISKGGRGTNIGDLEQPALVKRREGVLSDGGLRPGVAAQPVIYLAKFTHHFHPRVCAFMSVLSRDGIPGLLTLQNQASTGDGPDPNTTLFQSQYYPEKEEVYPSYPHEDVDFLDGDASAAYALYNWEVFFHIPLLIATKLSQDQRFDEAQQWFHYIFNPTTSSPASPPQRYWQVLPFQQAESERIADLLALLDYKGCDPDTLARQKKMETQVDEWRHNPFNPYLLARLRHTAYQKNVVMRYIDNLIAWGDQQFRQGTMESINQATLLYVLASEILGPRPERVPVRGMVQPQTYKDLQPQLDNFSNTLVNLENQFPFSSSSPSVGGNSNGTSSIAGVGTTFYFCIPQNDKLVGYWNIVEDRLLKIRNCMNIEGVVHLPPLVAPPIDVALLTQAAAMGVDLNSALNDISAATPHYRFTYMLQKALELCSELKALGAALLGALEMRDAEALAILRAGQESTLLSAVLQVKEQQLRDAESTLEGVQKSKEVVQGRLDYYSGRKPRNDRESEQIQELNTAEPLQEASQQKQIEATNDHLIPNIDLGISGISSPVVTAVFGGQNLGSRAQAAGQSFALSASIHTHKATMVSILGGWDRRQDEWTFQASQAQKEMDQIEKQIAAAQIRVAIAQAEIDTQLKQIRNAQAIEDFMRSKYTNEELYDWMVSQVSAIFFQCYQIAYDIAKRVEKAYRFERGLTSSNFIQFGYWDSLKKGLLSSERLYLDLKRLEMANIDQNAREYEVTKHISLVLHNPLTLMALKETGACIVELPEMLFDMDYPGHYMRRIKNVTLTIPCVAGPYTGINCTLTLLSNKIRIDSDAQSYTDDGRLVTTFGAIESIATSTAQNDGGLFELNFRDERYLPFEGSGVISRWRIDMPRDCNAFDFATISDVILKISYTAREGGDLLRQAARQARDKALADTQTQQARLFSAKHEFSGEWHRFLYPADTALSQALPLTLSTERFPYLFRGKQLSIYAMRLFLKLKGGFTYDDGKALTFTLKNADTAFPPTTFKAGGSPIDALPYAEPLDGKIGSVGLWSIEMLGADIQGLDNALKKTVTVNGQPYYHLNPDAFDDIWLVCEYTVK